jgi:hypothetical protein
VYAVDERCLLADTLDYMSVGRRDVTPFFFDVGGLAMTLATPDRNYEIKKN